MYFYAMENQEITIRSAQQLVDTWIRTTGVRYFSELTNMAILTEEVGEVARLMSRIYGDQSFKVSEQGKQLADELADAPAGLAGLAGGNLGAAAGAALGATGALTDAIAGAAWGAGAALGMGRALTAGLAT